MVYQNESQLIKNRTHVSLEIKVFTEANEGTYVCESSDTDFSFLVVMLKAPSNMIIYNETSNGCIYGYVDRDLSLTCQITSGTPKGNVYWKKKRSSKPYFVTTNKATQYSILSQNTNVIADIVSFAKPVDAAVFTDNMFIGSYSKNVQSRVIDTVYGQNINVQGIRLSFPIHIQCADDFRPYTVIVNNTHGSSNYTINLSLANDELKTANNCEISSSTENGKQVDKPPDSDKDDISDDGFASAEVVKSMKRKTKHITCI
ncbi:TTN [Mytilus edulis]|uniref:TTN n=1 Tax=Mytilus edulis TaxID=6550 RepID=A0A8S3UXJ9_MYTED|nr:TTN [Mytilus edulis]